MDDRNVKSLCHVAGNGAIPILILSLSLPAAFSDKTTEKREREREKERNKEESASDRHNEIRFNNKSDILFK